MRINGAVDERTDVFPRARAAYMCLLLLLPALVLTTAFGPAAVAQPADRSEPRARPVSLEPERSPGAPAGFVEMRVAGVVTTEAGPAVVLSDPGEDVLLPIFVGQTEALAISLRLSDEPFPRPLTYDLVDALLREFGGEIIEVRIDALQDHTYVATLRIRHGEREFILDSRASDSIAIALGQAVPIFVSIAVVREAGLGATELGHPGPSVESGVSL